MGAIQMKVQETERAYGGTKDPAKKLEILRAALSYIRRLATLTTPEQ